MKNAALVLIEFQNEWLDPSGKLRFLLKDIPQFNQSIEHAKQALDAARKTGMKVIHMGLHLYHDHREMGGLGATQFGLRGAIPRAGTWRTNETGHVHPEPFAPRDNEFAGAGRTGGSVFAGTNLDIYLRNNNIKQVYLMGYALHVCVLSSLCQGHDLGYEMKVLEDCCAAFTKEQRQSILTDVVHHFGERVTNEVFMQRLSA
jgi:biuret amidohydrolase